MKWSLAVHLPAPVPAQALRSGLCHVTVELPAPVLGVYAQPVLGDPALGPNDLMDQHLRMLGFQSRPGPADSQALHIRPPAPWRQLPSQPDETQRQRAHTVDLACVLRIVPSPAQPTDPGRVHADLEKTPDLGQRIREAVGFALLDLKAHWDEGNSLLAAWQNGVRNVLHERAPGAPARVCPIPLLQTGFDLLEVIAGLRGRRVIGEDLEQTWRNFQDRQEQDPPLAFQMAFFSEAIYRLTEQGDANQAERCAARLTDLTDRLMALLPGIDEDLRGGMWWHHLGRLAYYRGDFVKALALFATQWRVQDHLDSTRRTRLGRNAASVLTDLGYLAGAEQFIRDALAIQETNAEPERYKTWGRLGEILLRQQRWVDAAIAYEHSLEVQNPGERSGQTLVYLGHTALLQGDTETAELYYKEAEALNTHAAPLFNPYLWMGRTALGLGCDATEQVQDIWDVYGEDFQSLGGPQTLPAAVVATGVHLAGKSRAGLLSEFVARLIETNYVIEALYPLTVAYRSPREAKTPINAIRGRLVEWRDAYREFCAQTGLDLPADRSSTPNPDALIPALERSLEQNRWEPLAPFRALLFPMNLLEWGTPKREIHARR